MEIIEEKKEHAVIMGLIGKLDSNTAGEFENKLMALFDGGEKQLVADLSRLDYISSAGLRVFLVGAKRASSEQGKLIICSMQTQVKEVFDIAGFSSLFPMYDSREEALEDARV